MDAHPIQLEPLSASRPDLKLELKSSKILRAGFRMEGGTEGSTYFEGISENCNHTDCSCFSEEEHRKRRVSRELFICWY